MKVSKGQSRPEIVAAAFLILYMVLGSPFLYQVFDCDSTDCWLGMGNQEGVHVKPVCD